VAEFRFGVKVHRDLWSIWRFIAEDNAVAATEVIAAVYRTFATLAEYPRMGVKRNFARVRRSDIRSWRVSGFENYVIVYYPIPEGVFITGVYHSARDIEKLLDD
jgi:toxin ParE1/3/4